MQWQTSPPGWAGSGCRQALIFNSQLPVMHDSPSCRPPPPPLLPPATSCGVRSGSWARPSPSSPAWRTWRPAGATTWCGGWARREGGGQGNGKELRCSLPSADSSCVHHPHHLPSTSHPPAHVSAGPQAMGCSKIVAERSTITGSIGVVTGKFNLAGLYEKLGYNKEVLSRCGNQQRGSAAGKGWFARACSACCCRPFLRCP